MNSYDQHFMNVSEMMAFRSPQAYYFCDERMHESSIESDVEDQIDSLLDDFDLTYGDDYPRLRVRDDLKATYYQEDATPVMFQSQSANGTRSDMIDSLEGWREYARKTGFRFYVAGGVWTLESERTGEEFKLVKHLVGGQD